MLSELYIENIAVIEQATVTLGMGLNVLTGETGAGKSVLIGAIGMITGGRVSKEIIRTGAQKARVVAVFSDIDPQLAAKLEEMGFAADGELQIGRELTVEGKTSVRINGIPATVAALREMSPLLMDIHGQHDNNSLTNSSVQQRLIDRYGGYDELLNNYRNSYREYTRIKGELSAINTDEAEKSRRIDMLSFQIKEIEQVRPVEGEEEKLTDKRDMLRNAEKIADNLKRAYIAVTGGEEDYGAQGLVSAGEQYLSKIARYSDDFAVLLTRFTGISDALGELGEELRAYTEELGADDGELDRIENRLDELYRLKRKYGATIEDVISFYTLSVEELDGIVRSDERIEKLSKELTAAKKKLFDLAEKLSEERMSAAGRFTKEVEEGLAFLNMPSVCFTISNERTEPGSDGIDSLEFLISANKGEPPRPIAKIASGGELARIMLSIKNALAQKDEIEVQVFDEIDAGVSGRAATKIGIKLKQVSGTRQVICITHLAQIAAMADTHLLIEKKVREERTFTEIINLDMDGRVQELARIMSGAQVSAGVLASAKELLEQSMAAAIRD